MNNETMNNEMMNRDPMNREMTCRALAQSLRGELYERICGRLRRIYRLSNGAVRYVPLWHEVPEGAAPMVQHIDLWNENVAFVEQDVPWGVPAVFVELRPIAWECIVGFGRYVSEPEVRLHIVTIWDALEAVDDLFVLPEAIHSALCQLRGEGFCSMDLAQSHTNHNHEELVESIEVYRCVAHKSVVHEEEEEE